MSPALTAFFAAFPGAIISIVVGVLVARMNKKLDKRDREKAEKDEAAAKNAVMITELIMASLTLSEATAEAVQRIPDAHCNGNMHTALDEARAVKKKYRQFETEQTARALSSK